MAKDYNIDDILSEVKKRRIENEEKIKNGDSVVNDIKKTDTNDTADKNIEQEEVAQENIQKTEQKEIQKKALEIEQENVIEDSSVEKKVQDVESEETENIESNNTQDNDSIIFKRAQNIDDKAENNSQLDSEESDNDEYVPVKAEEISEEEALSDVNKYAKKYTLGDLSVAEYEELDQELVGKTRKNKVWKILLIILAVLLAIAIAIGVYFNTMLNKISSQNADPEYEISLNNDYHEFPTIEETDASRVSSFKDMLQQWYYNGEPAKSSDVLNIMLIGEDVNESNRGDKEILDSGVRADSVIIVSVNRSTKQISLTSVLRDTYAYYETEPGNKKTGMFGKINGAMSAGDVHAYINAVERLYKVNIDNYVIVNFESFKSIIDALGGVTLEITDREINHVNKNSDKYYGGVKIKKKFEGDKGRQKLNGIEALTYCRIRHLDSDNMRANRQKACLIEIFNELKDSSKVQLVNVATKLLPYVKAGFTKNEIVDLIGVALQEGWLNYEIRLNTVPNYRINEKGAGGNYYGAWCWKSDFPQDSYDLQMYIYGRTNIILAKTRVDVINCKQEGFFEKGAPAVRATIDNKHYGEVSTFERPTYVAPFNPEVGGGESPTTTQPLAQKETTTKTETTTKKKETTTKTETTTEKKETTTEKAETTSKPVEKPDEKPTQKPEEGSTEKDQTNN